MKTTSILSFSASLLLALPAVAGTTIQPAGPSAVMTTTTEGGLEITLGLYAWGAGVDGDTGFGGFVAPVDISFSDILSSLDMTAMGMLELRKGPWMFQLEGLYLKNSIESQPFTTAGGGPFTAELVARTTRVQPMIGYRVVENESTKVDLLAGAVYYDISNQLSFRGVGAPPRVSGGDDWIDPMVGVRVVQRVSERVIFSGRADIGGFGVNSDLAWQLVGMFGYELKDSINLFAGWRHAAVDYDKNGFTYDVANSGPILGATFTW
ncbi:MAG: hypothetical protein AB8D78_13840 [Akkermansiaceae bacterium]